MTSNIKIATWNVCLGLASKKELVKDYIIENNITVCCLQETELNPNLNENLLTFPGYSLEVERNDFKRRVAMYVNNRLEYRRREDLEGLNNHIVIIDILGMYPCVLSPSTEPSHLKITTHQKQNLNPNWN